MVGNVIVINAKVVGIMDWIRALKAIIILILIFAQIIVWYIALGALDEWPWDREFYEKVCMVISAAEIIVPVIVALFCAIYVSLG